MNLAFAAIIIAGLGGPSRPEVPPAFYAGNAFDLKTGKPVYIEEHREVRDGDRRIGIVTEYKDLSGKVIVRRTARFEAHPTVAAFLTEDLRDGYQEGAEVRNDSVRFFWRKDRFASTADKMLNIPGQAAVDAGFNNYVQMNWDDLRSGKTLPFQFGVPASLDYYSFRLYKRAEQTEGGRTLMTLVCDIDNFFLRLFLDPIVLTYDTGARRLVSYEGISNIRDGEGDNYRVRIVFDPYGP